MKRLKAPTLHIDKKDIKVEKLKQEFYYAYGKRFTLNSVRNAVRTSIRTGLVMNKRPLDWDLIDSIEIEYYTTDISFQDLSTKHGLAY